MTQKNYHLSKLANNISPSPTMAVDALAKSYKQQGEDVCGFGAGEPDFDTPEFIKEACVKALTDGMTKYIPAGGLPALRDALVTKYKRDNGLTIKPTQALVTAGGKYACYLAILATCEEGDEVIIPAPYWVSYPEMVKMVGAKPVYVFAGQESGFKITPEQLEAAITPKTRMLIINSPSNPTGAIYSKEELEQIAAIAVKHQIYVMSDEIYEYLLYDGVTHHSMASLSDEAAHYVITVAGLSKTFSMTGWRLGTIVAPEPVAKAMASILSHTTSNATTFAQYGALAAIENKAAADEAVNGMLVHFDRRRNLLFDGLNSIDGISCDKAKGAFYLFPKMDSFGLSSADFATKLLNDKKVAVVPGDGFGAEGYMRLSYATSDEVIEKGLARLKDFCGAL